MAVLHLVIAACLSCQTGVGDSSLGVRDVLERWGAGASLLDRYDLQTKFQNISYITIDQKILPPDQPVMVETSYAHLLRSSTRRRGEFRLLLEGPIASTMVYDGQTLVSHDASGHEYQIQKIYDYFGLAQHDDYEGSYRTLFGTTDRIEESKKRASRLLAREGPLYVIDVPQSKPGPFWELTWKVWLDPARNFMPIRWSQWVVKSGQSLHDCDCELELKEVVSGVWAPVKAEYSIYNKNVKSPVFGKKAGSASLVIDLEKSTFDAEVSDDQFTLKIPNGVTVVDRIRNAVYKQGASDPQAYLDRLVAEGKNGVEKLTKVGPPGSQLIMIPTPPFWTSGRIALLVAGAILALTAFAVFWWRR